CSARPHDAPLRATKRGRANDSSPGRAAFRSCRRCTCSSSPQPLVDQREQRRRHRQESYCRPEQHPAAAAPDLPFRRSVYNLFRAQTVRHRLVRMLPHANPVRPTKIPSSATGAFAIRFCISFMSGPPCCLYGLEVLRGGDHPSLGRSPYAIPAASLPQFRRYFLPESLSLLAWLARPALYLEQVPALAVTEPTSHVPHRFVFRLRVRQGEIRLRRVKQPLFFWVLRIHKGENLRA